MPLAQRRCARYLGRADQQVKIRGFRIEPGEIEAALGSHPAVQQALVAVRALASGDKQLVGYVTCKSDVSAADLRAHLLGRLPAYLIPEVFVTRQRFPLNANGKVDCAALPEPGTH